MSRCPRTDGEAGNALVVFDDKGQPRFEKRIRRRIDVTDQLAILVQMRSVPTFVAGCKGDRVKRFKVGSSERSDCEHRTPPLREIPEPNSMREHHLRRRPFAERLCCQREKVARCRSGAVTTDDNSSRAAATSSRQDVGATTLGESAIDIVEEFISTQHLQAPQEFAAALEKLVREILEAQPSMAVMLNLAQCVLETCADDAPFSGMKQRVQQTLSEFRRALRLGMEALCRQAIEILPRMQPC
jgi:hypothetical protein